jgi:hypothetical protein
MEKRVSLFLLYLAALLMLCPAGRLRASPQSASKLTPDQVENVHSRLFHKGPVGQIPDLVSKTTGDIYIPCVVGVAQKVAVPLVDNLAMLAADSDLVIQGQAESGTTHLNATKDFLYTDWTFTVEEVLKNNSRVPVQMGATILVARPGGKVQISGRTVYATCADFQEFASGQSYLLYLHFIPETGAYAIDGGSKAFTISSTPRRLDSVNYHEPEASDKETLLKDARDAVATSIRIPRRSGGHR